MRAYQDQVTELGNKLTAKEQENANLSAQVSSLQNRINEIESGRNSSGGGGGGSVSTDVGAVVGFTGSYYYDSWGARPAGHYYSGQAGAVYIDSYTNTRNKGEYGIHISSHEMGDLGWVKPSQLFDTGGYTGSWGSGEGYDPQGKNGKVAFLHQKELVLNETDTSNLLNVINMVRQMTSQLKTGSFANVFSLSGADAAKQNQTTEIQQDVHITAEFPAVNSSAEIESALLSLNDRAIQYANRS